MSNCTIFPNKRFYSVFVMKFLLSLTILSVVLTWVFPGKTCKRDKQYETRFLVMMTTLFQFGDDLRVIVFVRL